MYWRPPRQLNVMHSSPFVSVIVVNYNGRRILGNCLQSLADQSYPRHNFEVIVVDNASSDGSETWIRTEFPWVRVVQTGTNLGFAGGNNAGFALARGAWIALLNNDAVADRYWLQNSVVAGQREDSIGGVASHLIFQH